MTMEREFGRALDDALGDGPPDVALRVQRANVLEAMHRVDRPLERVRWEFAAGLLAVALVASALFVWQNRNEAASASLRGGAELVASSTVTSGEHAETIDFSDGSRVLLEPRAAARVVRLDRQYTELALKSGKLEASVQHREGASWTIVAGPYEVHVVGTKFTVDWQQASNAFRVAVTEGRVRVTGGELGEHVVYLEPGQQWERRDAAPAAPAPPAPPPPVAENAEPEPEPALEAAPAPAVSPQTVAPRSSRAVASAPPPDRPPTIAELTKSGKYRDALELAEQQGFERVISELSEGELLGLGNAARYTGQRGRARQAMLAVRDRFSGRPAAGLAALYLARIAEQLDHNPKEAARWLRVFLAGSPTGSLAADARASLLSILLASGDTAGATAVARDYLRFHPNGPVADRARVLVTRADSK
jgi:hypothetical protein